jgi:dihydrodipicolinate synthase/N-acetylneuraminate lyase
VTIPGDIIIPALTFRTAGGELDEPATAHYAETAAGTWLDYFILSGTTTEGDTFTVGERAQVLDIWLKTTDKSRLVACCWNRADIDAALERGIRPMAVMRGLRDENEAIAFFRTLPAGAFAYSHPTHTVVVLTPALLGTAVHTGCRPAGAKISKLNVGDLPLVRRSGGDSFAIWDGSARQLQESLTSGANGVVATSLSSLPAPFPKPHLLELDSYLKAEQRDLDLHPEPSDRADWLKSQFRYWRT